MFPSISVSSVEFELLMALVSNVYKYKYIYSEIKYVPHNTEVVSK